MRDSYEAQRSLDAPSFDSLLDDEPVETAERRYQEAAGASAVEREPETDDALKMEDTPSVGFGQLARTMRDKRYKQSGSEGDEYRDAVSRRASRSLSEYQQLWTKQAKREAEQEAKREAQEKAQREAKQEAARKSEAAAASLDAQAGVGSNTRRRSLVESRARSTAQGPTGFQVALQSFEDAVGEGLSAGFETAGEAAGDYRDMAALSLQEHPIYGRLSSAIGGGVDGLRKAYPETAEAAREIGFDPLLPTQNPAELARRREAGASAVGQRLGAAANAVASVAEDVAAIPGAVASLPDKAEEAYAALEWALSPERTREEKDAFWRLAGKGAAGGAAVLAERTLGRLANAALGKGGLRPDLADLDDGSLVEILARGKLDDQAAYERLKEKLGRRPEEDYWGQELPSWQKAQADNRAWNSAKPSPSYLKERVVSHGTKGSSLPDDLYPDGTTYGETKRYDVGTGKKRRDLARRAAEQIGLRVENLPPGSKQVITVDVRGRNFEIKDLDDAAQRIHDKTGGIVQKGEIRFRIGSGEDDWLEFD